MTGGGRARRCGAALIASLLTLTLCGCVASRQQPGQADAAVESALELASSAVETTTLTVTLLDDDRLTSAVADTAIADQIGELADASAALTTLVPPDDDSASARADGLTAVAQATAAVVAARAFVARDAGAELSDAGEVPADASAAVDLLDTASEAIDALLGQG